MRLGKTPTKYITAEVAAQRLGISKQMLFNLERLGIVRPLRVATPGGRDQRAYSEADLQAALNHYAAKGGPQRARV